MFCSNCGHEVADTDAFCPSCGSPLRGRADGEPLGDPMGPLPVVDRSRYRREAAEGKTSRVPSSVLAVLFALATGVVVLAVAAVVGFGGSRGDGAGTQAGDQPAVSEEARDPEGEGASDDADGSAASEDSTDSTDADDDASPDPDATDDESADSADDDPATLLESGKRLLAAFEEDGDRSPLPQAFDAFSRASEGGSTGADYYLGYCYYLGLGTERSYGDAYRHALVAAQAGDARAQALVGRCLYDGSGVARDRDESYLWASRAAAQGDPEGQNLLGNCYKHGYGAEKDLGRMIRCYELAADAGNDNGQVNLGACYYEGLGVEKDLARAVELYERAADQGNSLAQLYLAGCYYDGEGVPRDVDLARSYAERAASNARDTRASDDARAFLAERGL